MSGTVFVVYLRDRQIHVMTGIEVWRRESSWPNADSALNRAQQVSPNAHEVRIVEEPEIAGKTNAE